MTETEKPIVILGGGFAGLRLARRLSAHHQALRRPILLIDRQAHHVYTPLLFEVASACADGDDKEEALLAGTTFRFSDLLHRYPGVTLVQENIEAIDGQRRTVTYGGGKKIEAATLVCALGSEPDFFGIPGLEQKALTLKTWESACVIRRRITAFVKKKRLGQAVAFQIFVGGGGATGVELAAELAGAFRLLEQHGAVGKSDWSITLVEALPCLLNMLPPALSEVAKQRLESLGVKVHLDTCIKRLEDRVVVLAPRPLRPGEKREELVCAFPAAFEKTFETDMMIWTGGVRGHSVLQHSGLARDRKGRVVVHGGMGIADHPGVYVIGDCAAPTNPVTPAQVPLLAQAALAEAEIAATQILADHGVRVLRRSYTFPSYVYTIPLGGKQAIAAMGGMTFTGFLGWLIRQGADFFYFLSLFPLPLALRVFFGGMRNYSHND